MVLNIPTRIPGQTLESLFALICLNNPEFGSCRHSPKELRRLLASGSSGTREFVANELLERMLKEVGIKQADAYIAKYTYQPIFETFLDSSVESRIERSLDAKVFEPIHTHLRFEHIHIQRANMYCPHCALSQLDLGGFAAPDTVHQVRHVKICVDHKSQLIAVSPPSTESPIIQCLGNLGLLLDWARPTLEVHLQSSVQDDQQSQTRARLIYARAVREALHRSLLPPCGLIAHKRAIKAATERRLQRPLSGEEHLLRLIFEMHGLEAVIGLMRIERTRSQSENPLHHLLAISVLFDDLDEYKSTVQQYYEKTRTLVSKSGTQPAPSVQEPEEAGVS